MITPDNKPVYKIDRLIAIFAAALDAKQAQVSNLKIGEPGGTGDWAASWPQGNVNEERRVLGLLKDWKAEGIIKLQTDFPLADPDLTENSSLQDRLTGFPERTLAAQIRNDQVVKLAV
ncbi:MAG: hypothetical protein ACK4NR_02975 [Micavibrio sp.]